VHEPDHEGLERARQQLAKARADEPRVAELVETLHRKIRENHFGPKIAAALREEHR
jgi:hypothetical protein